MKAKITPRQEIILLYQPEKVVHGDKLPEIFSQIGIAWKTVAQQELGFTVGELAGYRKKEESKQENFTSIPEVPAMVMGGISGKRLDQLLNLMNQERIELPIKMVITPHNENWMLGELIKEVSKEHELFLAMERLKRLTMRAQNMEEQEAHELVKLARDALSRMRGQDDKQPTLEELESLSERLESLF